MESFILNLVQSNHFQKKIELMKKKSINLFLSIIAISIFMGLKTRSSYSEILKSYLVHRLKYRVKEYFILTSWEKRSNFKFSKLYFHLFFMVTKSDCFLHKYYLMEWRTPSTTDLSHIWFIIQKILRIELNKKTCTEIPREPVI